VVIKVASPGSAGKNPVAPVGARLVMTPASGVDVPVAKTTICVLSIIDLTTAVLPAPKLPVNDVAVSTIVGAKLPVPLTPIILNCHDVVEIGTIELIVVSGIISPVAFTALRNPTVGLLVPPNAKTVIDEVPVFVTNTVFPTPRLAVLPTAEITEPAGNPIEELNPVMVNDHGPPAGALNVGIVGGAGTPTNVCVVPVAVNV
jgi:hypothetical protein